MKLKSVRLSNFKRFTDLQIVDIPESTKLVLLVGANGSGKSSVFDAFECFNTAQRQGWWNPSSFLPYYLKDQNAGIEIDLDLFEYGKVLLSNQQTSHSLKHLPQWAFYGRSSFRQTPRLTRTNFGQSTHDSASDTDRPRFYIDRDERLENDIERITGRILKEFYNSDKPSHALKMQYIEPINKALTNIFGEGNGNRLYLKEIIPPLDNKVAQITFQKGNVVFHYDLLSAGEKEVFNILINLISRKDLYQNAIYFFDELDLHLHTQLQYRVLEELVKNWIPENSQIWVATHSLGFIEYAKQTEDSVIIDFDDLDYDIPQVLFPEVKDNPNIYEIAVGKDILPSLFREMDIFFVENNDKQYYANLDLENTIFVSDNSRNTVFHKVRTTGFKGIVDRDFLSDGDIIEIRKQYPKLFILSYYSIENYFFHPDNLAEHYLSLGQLFDKQQYIKDLLLEKNRVKSKIIPTLAMKRTEYPYFGEPSFDHSSLQRRFKNKQENVDESELIGDYLESDDFETFYKVLPMKTYCTQLVQRQNLKKNELVKTNWFKTQMRSILTQKVSF